MKIFDSKEHSADELFLRVDAVTKKFKTGKNKDTVAVDNVTFRVAPGELIAVIGHNGAGKTTLFNLLGGFLRPSSGNVQWNIPSTSVGWCPQREIIDWSLTVRQNIAIGLELKTRISRRELARQTEEIASLLGLKYFLDHQAETLSGGELRRTQIARALVSRPQLFILDEPTTGLDPDGIKTVFSYLDEKCKNGATAIISTHETSKFASFCTRVLAMRSGRLIADLSKEEFMKYSASSNFDLWEAYLGLLERA